MEIIVPGGTRRSKEGGGRIGYSQRVVSVRRNLDHLPPWRCDSFTKGRFYLCGRCFGMLGDGPTTSGSEMWMDGTDRNGNPIVEEATGRRIVPAAARCHKCGGPAWPAD
jgi:hypothetical protein